MSSRCLKTLEGGRRGVMTHDYPQNIGILAAEIYFPNSFVSQADLEAHDKIPEGKYTVGLGQEGMAVVTDLEDVNSMCMTVITLLLERNNTPVSKIGRLEVGTETIQDKSKSVKSYLMELFFPHTDICGVDNVNACYGGTAALLNSIAWIESADWDGRLALVVAGDIAIYEKGPARPTGGAGAVAFIIGPDAPIAVERGTAAHYMKHAYDFYKPNPADEYPVVDGQNSIICYLQALDACYNLHLDHLERKKSINNPNVNIFDYLVFHSPYGKLVQKSFGRLFFNDALRNPNSHPELLGYRDAVVETTYTSRQLDTVLQNLSHQAYEIKTLPSRLISKQIGNCYCASVYFGLVALLSQLDEDSFGKRIGVFSYGSGLAATMFSLKIVGNISRVTGPLEGYVSQLNNRNQLSALEFERLLEDREKLYCARDWMPKTPVETLRPGTFYLEKVDEKFRRFYNIHTSKRDLRH